MIRSSMALVLLLAAVPAAAQRHTPPTAEELAAITAHGRELAAYDRAAWYASDSVMAAPPIVSRINLYVARRDGERWVVSFGRRNAAADTFFVAYQAVGGAGPMSYTVRTFDPPQAATRFELVAARASALAKRDFGRLTRPYNFSALAEDSGRVWVYATPAQTQAGRCPLGGDVRYLISADGTQLVAKRQLHRTLVEFGPDTPRPDGSQIAEDTHIAVLDVVPEDTDVFFTLQREPHVPHMVVTDEFMYQIAPDGSITYLGVTREILKP